VWAAETRIRVVTRRSIDFDQEEHERNGTVALSDRPVRLPPLRDSNAADRGNDRAVRVLLGAFLRRRASTLPGLGDAFRLNATVPAWVLSASAFCGVVQPSRSGRSSGPPRAGCGHAGQDRIGVGVCGPARPPSRHGRSRRGGPRRAVPAPVWPHPEVRFSNTTTLLRYSSLQHSRPPGDSARSSAARDARACHPAAAGPYSRRWRRSLGTGRPP
jgi:hypothetical protein